MLLTKGSSFQVNSYNDVTVNLKIPSESAVTYTMFILDKSGIALEHRVVTPDEYIELPLGNLPKRAQNVSFVVSADQSLSLQAAQLNIQINKHPLCKYILNEIITTEKAFILGEFYKFGKGWKFRALGQGYYGGLGAVLNNFSLKN